MGFFYVEATEEVKGNHLHLADLHGHLAVEKEFTEGRVVHLANQVDVLRGTDKAVHERGNLSEQKKIKKYWKVLHKTTLRFHAEVTAGW